MREPFCFLTGKRGDGVKVLVDVQYRQARQFGCRGDEQIRDRRATVVSAVGKQGLHLERTSSILGVRYSTGIADSGGSRNSRRAISPHSAENPTSKRVTPVMCTRPRSIRFDQISMSGLSVSRTSADLSISQRWSVTSTPDA